MGILLSDMGGNLRYSLGRLDFIIFRNVMNKLVLIALATGLIIMNSTAAKASPQAVVRDEKEAVWQEVDDVYVPIPPTEHPRLYIRSEEIPALREKMKTKDGRTILRKLREAAVPRTPEEEAAETDHGFRYYFKMRGLTSEVQLQALDYLTEGDEKQGRMAITAFLDTLKTTNFGTKSDLSRASGVMLMVGAMIYDWCYDIMTAEEKQSYINEFIRIAGTMECHYPPKNTEPIAGHSSEWMVLRDMLSAGIAVYDEYPDMYNYVATMLFRDYVPVRNYIYSGHNYHQGTGYVTVRFANDLICQWILDKMGAGAVFDGSQQFVLYDFIYRRRPDGQVIPAGDVNPSNRKSPTNYAMPAMLAASYYGDEYLAYEYERKPSVEPHLLMMELLWRDFDLKGKAPYDLPLTMYSGTPFGWMIARTGWGDSSVIAEMKVNEHFVGNHQHLDGGSFQLYYKGPLAIDSGSYQGSAGGYNSPHNKNYFKRTIAHNSLLIYDPSEKFACWNYGGSDKTEYAANDGGQRMPGDKWDTCRSFEDFLGESYTVGETLAHGFGPDVTVPEYSYLKGDITKAYSSEKANDVRRSFVFLNLQDNTVPAALIVYDHVESTDPAFKKYWLLHSIEEPEIDGVGINIRRTTYGDNGMLHCDALLPASPSISKIGGDGREFWVFGENYPNHATTRPDPANERGAWRVEICPSVEQTEDVFLNVLQVADNGCESFHETTLIENESIVGVVIDDRMVVFSRTLQPLKGGFTVTVPGMVNQSAGGGGSDAIRGASYVTGGSSPSTAGIIRLLITDLQPGTWQVRKNGETVYAALPVHDDDGTLYIDVTPGTYTFLR